MFSIGQGDPRIPTAQSRRSGLRARVSTLGVLAVLLVAWPAAGYEAYTVFINGDLMVLDLEDGELTAVGDTGLLPALALARSPSGELFAVAKPPGLPELPWELWTLDPATGAATSRGVVGDFTLRIGDLTSDAAGDLWLAAAGDLYAVDPTTGEATLVGAGGSLEALAARGGGLYGIAAAASGPARWQLVSIDTTSGAASPIVGLPALDEQEVLRMDFDDVGRLWVLAIDLPGIPVPPPTVVFRADDPSSGELELAFDLGGTFEGLAVAVSRTPLEIPALDRHGLLLLAAFLLAAAVYGLRRQRGTE